MVKGPLTSDEVFFTEALDQEAVGLKDAASSSDWASCRRIFASYVRRTLDRVRFSLIPYETPENIYKLPGESDSEACKRIEGLRMVSVGVVGDFSARGRVDWTANPTVNGYKEWTWQLSRHNEIKMMAHEYRLTHDEALAGTACAIMRSWIEDAVCPPLGTIGYATDCWRTIECGIRMGANWPYILFSFIDSPSFDDGLLVDWFKSVYEHALRLSHDRTGFNWLVMEMNGLAHIGLLFPFFKKAGTWFDDAVSTLDGQLDEQFYPDGFQYELTTNYHDVVVNNYQRLFETARAFGRALPDSLRSKLLNACHLYVKLMKPDGRLPDINDGCKAYARDLLLPKARFFMDDDIAFVLGSGKAPGWTSTVLPYSGFVVWRTGWGEDDTWGFLDAAPFGRAHQHEDKLNFLMHACGRDLVTEGGNYAYDDSPMRRYILSTRSHNTIRVDGADQDRRSHYEWHDGDINKPAGIRTDMPCDDDIEWAEGVYDEGYAGVDDHVVHKRRVLFIRPRHCFVILDRLSASTAHDYEQLWHIDDERQGDGFAHLDIRVLTPGARCDIVKGQDEPEVQGYIALGQAQGSYKAVDTLCVHVNAADVLMCTVLQAKVDGVGALEDASLDGMALTLGFPDARLVLDLAGHLD